MQKICPRTFKTLILTKYSLSSVQTSMQTVAILLVAIFVETVVGTTQATVSGAVPAICTAVLTHGIYSQGTLTTQATITIVRRSVCGRGLPVPGKCCSWATGTGTNIRSGSMGSFPPVWSCRRVGSRCRSRCWSRCLWKRCPCTRCWSRGWARCLWKSLSL